MSRTTPDRAGLAAKLRASGLTTVPGVYDMISARIADLAGFDALYMTGYGATASHLGIPDAGLISYAEMLSRVAVIAGGTRAPLIADADTGFGGLLNLERTVRGYEDAGAAAIQIEDQEFPKKCGHTLGRKVIPAEEMELKIRVAIDSREDPDLLIVARTDARTQHGLDEALRRGERYIHAGADILFIESPETEDEMVRICRSFDTPLVANMVEGGRTPILPAETLAEIGYRAAIFPAFGFLAAGEALHSAYRTLRETGSSHGSDQPLYEFEAFNRLMGFEEVWAFDKKWAQPSKPGDDDAET